MGQVTLCNLFKYEVHDISLSELHQKSDNVIEAIASYLDEDTRCSTKLHIYKMDSTDNRLKLIQSYQDLPSGSNIIAVDLFLLGQTCLNKNSFAKVSGKYSSERVAERWKALKLFSQFLEINHLNGNVFVELAIDCLYSNLYIEDNLASKSSDDPCPPVALRSIRSYTDVPVTDVVEHLISACTSLNHQVCQIIHDNIKWYSLAEVLNKGDSIIRSVDENKHREITLQLHTNVFDYINLNQRIDRNQWIDGELELIGQGVFGKTFKLSTTQLHSEISLVIKQYCVINHNPSNPVRPVWYRETFHTQRLSHENVIKYYGKPILYRKNCYCIMEFGGMALNDLYYKKKVMALKDIKKAMLQIASAIIYLHALFVIHRDIRTANVAVSRSGVYKLMDFGLCSEKTELDSRFTSDTNLGNHLWKSPEYCNYILDKENSEPPGRSSDIWMFGVFVIEMLDFPGIPNFFKTYIRQPALFMYRVINYERFNMQDEYIDSNRGWDSEIRSILSCCLEFDERARADSAKLLELCTEQGAALSSNSDHSDNDVEEEVKDENREERRKRAREVLVDIQEVLVEITQMEPCLQTPRPIPQQPVPYRPHALTTIEEHKEWKELREDGITRYWNDTVQLISLEDEEEESTIDMLERQPLRVQYDIAIKADLVEEDAISSIPSIEEWERWEEERCITRQWHDIIQVLSLDDGEEDTIMEELGRHHEECEAGHDEEVEATVAREPLPMEEQQTLDRVEYDIAIPSQDSYLGWVHELKEGNSVTVTPKMDNVTLNTINIHSNVFDVILFSAVHRQINNNIILNGDLQLIGDGGFGYAYRYTPSNSPGVSLVIKLNKMREQKCSLPAWYREVRHTRRLSHENIIKYYGLPILYENVYYCIMEDGGDTLFKLYYNKGFAVNFKDIKKAMLQITSAIHYIHNLDDKHFVIHRDIRADNVTVSSSGVYKLIDFGLCSEKTELDSRIESDLCWGHYFWKSPEFCKYIMFHGEDKPQPSLPPGRKSDIWMFGVFVLELLAFPNRPSFFEKYNRYTFIPKLSKHAININMYINEYIEKCLFPSSIIEKVLQNCLEFEEKKRCDSKELFEMCSQL